MPDVKFTSRSYFSVAQEHLALALRLAEQQEYVAAHYFAGVAVESILRALSVKEGDAFDSSHSIEYWAEKADLYPKATDEKQAEFRAKLQELNLRWRANQRYMSEKMLDTWLYSVNLDRNIRGNRVKYSSRRMLELASEVVGLGGVRWERKRSRRKTS